MAQQPATPINFETDSCTASPSAVLSHVVKWQSSTGELNDLLGIRTREHVEWDAPANTDFIGEAFSEYQTANHHNGLGTSLASTGRNTDNHSITGPFLITDNNFMNIPRGGLTFSMRQIYQYSLDGLTWIDFPNSNFTINRSIQRNGRNVTFSLIKVGGNGEIGRAEVSIPYQDSHNRSNSCCTVM